MVWFFIILLIVTLLTVGCSAKIITETDQVGAHIYPKTTESFTQEPEIESKEEKATLFETVKTEPSLVLQASSDDDEMSLKDLLTQDLSDKFDIPIVFNEAVQYFINYFTTEKRKVFSNWLKRSEKYVPLMKEILREEGLPEDLVYLAMIESGFNPRAYSPAKASGPWQFIYKTGERYGLRVDHWIDERRDPEKSTVAAARYLKDLFDQFGCWYLAAASYNVGEKKVEKVLEKHGTRDIWELIKYNTLPKETREYIPKLIAAAIIAKDPERFGFEKINYDNPIRFVKVKVPKATSLKDVAKCAGVDLETVRHYNPEILRGITPPDREFKIKLPEWVDVQAFLEKLSNILSSRKKLVGYFQYRVKKNDTIKNISARYKVPEEVLCLWNTDKETIRLKQGKILYIPRFLSEQDAKVAKNEDGKPRLAKYRKKIVYYKVKKGDTILKISKKYGVDPESIRSLNNLKNDRIYPGMTLKIACPNK